MKTKKAWIIPSIYTNQTRAFIVLPTREYVHEGNTIYSSFCTICALHRFLRQHIRLHLRMLRIDLHLNNYNDYSCELYHGYFLHFTCLLNFFLKKVRQQDLRKALAKRVKKAGQMDWLMADQRVVLRALHIDCYRPSSRYSDRFAAGPFPISGKH
jgi:hypothetical protein